MKKILLVLTLTTLIFACKKEDDKPTTTTPTKVEGCMDTLAINFDPAATEDDGSCQYAIIAGCMDTLAINYNPEATEDDGSCEYLPTELKLSSITVNSMPMTNNGANWDVGVFGLENPDVFYVLKQGAGDIVSSTSQDNIDACPISFTENLPYTITDLSQEYTIELYDNDQIGGLGENELIGSCSFIPNNFITVGGDEINITNNGIDMTLAIQWIQ
ncbi:hypothetical protein OAV36_02915 [Flavobacteriales bacterium]|mgnify:FL=1|jgi:hypothetical protein|nr:hypothetical protein [Flavobacteriales bacterium]MDC3305855.1 hypothetical protein [Flavobacteriales bacterium]MDG1348529.1 hypothetical protein [Flavobacteriales bacterium]|tara:strand:+ start:710 stop:1357 length:648 start_codon:yes stop_codon:yes gene_type:complete